MNSLCDTCISKNCPYLSYPYSRKPVSIVVLRCQYYVNYKKAGKK